MRVRFGFYLLGYKGYECLRNFIVAFGSESIEFVFTEQDKGSENDYFMEIVQLCNRESISILRRTDFIDAAASSELIRIAVGWRWLISDSNQLIVFHDSLLPKYRGFAPVVNALLCGEKIIGVTALWADDDYDAGDIILQRSLNVVYPIKINEAIEALTPLYVGALLEISKRIFSGVELKGTKQNQDNASYSVWRDISDYVIPWHRDSEYIKRFIDAVGYPYTGAKTLLNGKSIIVRDALVQQDMDINDRNQHIGKIIVIKDGDPCVICGKGILKLTSLINIETGLKPSFKFRSRFGD